MNPGRQHGGECFRRLPAVRTDSLVFSKEVTCIPSQNSVIPI
jgi:hypothetical protein